MIQFRCPGCGCMPNCCRPVMRVADTMAGQTIACLSSGATIPVPRASPADTIPTMSRSQWTQAHTLNDLDTMLCFAAGRISERKYRLLALAACRQIQEDLPQANKADVLKLLRLAERVAEGLASAADLEEPRHTLWKLAVDSFSGSLLFAVYEATCPAGRGTNHTVWQTVTRVTEIQSRLPSSQAPTPCGLLREFVNPFIHHPGRFGSSCVIQVATSLYAGDPCHFALHDALLDAGHAELAEHFREPYHPKGCWALDLLLGKS